VEWGVQKWVSGGVSILGIIPAFDIDLLKKGWKKFFRGIKVVVSVTITPPYIVWINKTSFAWVPSDLRKSIGDR
jgi:hypothetical protein